jgi:hypothetical protein
MPTGSSASLLAQLRLSDLVAKFGRQYVTIGGRPMRLANLDRPPMTAQAASWRCPAFAKPSDFTMSRFFVLCGVSLDFAITIYVSFQSSERSAFAARGTQGRKPSGRIICRNSVVLASQLVQVRYAPQQCLNLRPEPHGHGSFRPTF